MCYSAQIETDSTMTGEDKQISHCWGSLCKADIIMSLVSVREKKRDKWLRGAALLLDVSNIWCDTCFIQGRSRHSLANFITQSDHDEKTDRPRSVGESNASVSRLIKTNHAINIYCHLQFSGVSGDTRSSFKATTNCFVLFLGLTVTVDNS